MDADEARDLGLGGPRGCLFGLGVMIGVFLVVFAAACIIAN